MPAKRRSGTPSKRASASLRTSDVRPKAPETDKEVDLRLRLRTRPIPSHPESLNAEDEHEKGPPSESGTYDGEALDPALLDEEEIPHGAETGKAIARSGGGFNTMKSFHGQIYTGMAVGGSHTWNYQPGVWKETKKEPDLWEIDYTAQKVRNRRAPAGSGAPVGTEYHWYIVAHQIVKKIDANTYETHMTGSKYKLTHKNVNQKQWAVPTVKGQRERELFLLEDAKRRVEGLPPVLSHEKVKVGKKEKGQSTLANFFGPGDGTPRKRKAEAAGSPAQGGDGKKSKEGTL